MTEFSERVIKAAMSVPKGKVTTYGRIADAAGGGPMASRSVTAILVKAYKEGVDIPFHRIVYSDGRIWVSDKYRKKRLGLHKKEGVEIDEKDRIKNFPEVLFEFE